MTQPSNDELADALEKLADGDVPPGAEEATEAAEAPEENRPPLPATFPGAVPSATMIPDEIVGSDEPAAESDDIAMTELPAGETGSAPTSRPVQNRSPLYQTMKFRQTIIPILLTCGVLTLGFSSLKFAMGPDSIFSDLPIWLPITLMTAGAILLFLAVLNMLAVKHAR